MERLSTYNDASTSAMVILPTISEALQGWIKISLDTRMIILYLIDLGQWCITHIAGLDEYLVFHERYNSYRQTLPQSQPDTKR